MEIIPGNSISYDLHAPDTTFIADCWLTDIRLWNGMEEWVANNSMHSIRNRCHLAGIQTLLQSGINKNAWIHPLLAGNQRMRRQSVSQCRVAGGLFRMGLSSSWPQIKTESRMVIRRSSLLFTLLFQNVQVMWAANTVWYRQLIKIGERGTICGRPWMGCFVAFNWPESTLSITFWRWFHYEITRNSSLNRSFSPIECKIGYLKQNSFF